MIDTGETLKEGREDEREKEKDPRFAVQSSNAHSN